MRIIDADKFLEYLIFSKHIDSLKCGEVKKAVEMCKVKQPTVCDIDAIRDEISKAWYIRPKNKYEEGLKDQALKDIEIINKHLKGE